jgi:hypothetical protein
MSRGNPYGTDSFPAHERLTRNLLALANGSVTAESFGWPGHQESTLAVFRQTAQRERWLTRSTPLPWAGLLVSEQTRQFYAYKDIPGRFLAHLFGTFRCALEEHLPLTLLNDWDVTNEVLANYSVLVLANAAALSDSQTAVVREFVRGGGGLVATTDTSLFDELGRRRRDFALADLFGVSFRGHFQEANSKNQIPRTKQDGVLEFGSWNLVLGISAGTLTWAAHPLLRDPRLQELVPGRSVTFRGPLVRVTAPTDADAVAVRMKPEGANQESFPAVVARTFGKGRVVYFAAGVDAALWSYAYPYQRRLLARALEWAAREPVAVSVKAPMCVQATYFTQVDKGGRRLVIHLFNALNTTANHGLPVMDVPLREETVPIHGIDVRFHRNVPKSVHLEPGNHALRIRREGAVTVVEIPPLDIHAMVVGEY